MKAAQLRCRYAHQRGIFSATKWVKTYVCTTMAYDREVQKVHSTQAR